MGEWLRREAFKVTVPDLLPLLNALGSLEEQARTLDAVFIASALVAARQPRHCLEPSM